VVRIAFVNTETEMNSTVRACREERLKVSTINNIGRFSEDNSEIAKLVWIQDPGLTPKEKSEYARCASTLCAKDGTILVALNFFEATARRNACTQVNLWVEPEPLVVVSRNIKKSR
jgi:hypothetical protein